MYPNHARKPQQFSRYFFLVDITWLYVSDIILDTTEYALKAITISFLHCNVIDGTCIVAVLRAMDLAYPHCPPKSRPRSRVTLKLDLDDTTYETQVAVPGCDASWNEAFDMYVA